MSDERLGRLHELLVERRRPADRAQCPSAEQLRNLTERRLSQTARLQTLEHVMGCAACREEFDLLRSVVESGDRLTMRRPAWFALAASLALIVGAGALWQLLGRGEEPVLRGGASVVLLVAPAVDAEVAPPPTLIWRRVAGARQYRVEVLDSAGAVELSFVTPDSAASLSGRRLSAGAAYQWWVRAALDDGSERRSVVSRFRLRLTGR